MSTSKQTGTMTELLRQAIRESPSLRALYLATGVDRAALRRFRDGETSLRLDIADRLAAHFGIECRPTRRRKG